MKKISVVFSFETIKGILLYEKALKWVSIIVVLYGGVEIKHARRVKGKNKSLGIIKRAIFMGNYTKILVVVIR